MKTKCKFKDGPVDGSVMEIEDGIKQVVIPGMGDCGLLISHEYTRTDIALFEFVKSAEVSDSAPRSNLDYVFCLKDTISALETENAAMREALRRINEGESFPEYHTQGMGCGLEDRDIRDRYDAMEYGWEQCEERVIEWLSNELEAALTPPIGNGIYTKRVRAILADIAVQYFPFAVRPELLPFQCQLKGYIYELAEMLGVTDESCIEWGLVDVEKLREPNAD